MKLKDARGLNHEELYERRKQTVILFKKGMTRKEIGEVVGVSNYIAGQWIKLWKEGGMTALKTRAKGRPYGRGLTLSTAQQKEIQKCLIEKYPEQYKMDFALWTRGAVQGLIKELYRIEMPIRTVGSYLQRWGFTPQKPVKRAYERNDKKVKEWMEESYPQIAKQAKNEGAEIHWGDETGVRSQDQVGRGFSPKGKTPVRPHGGRRESINMISSITNQGKVRFMFYEDTMNSQMLIKFLRRLIRGAKRKIHLILDNLKCHHSKLVKEWVAERKNQIELHFLPSYSPDLNPDEYLNCDLKAELAKSASRKKKGAFKELTKSTMRSLAKKAKRVASYFTSSKLQYINNCN